MLSELPLDALEMALWTRARAGHDTAGVVHHSDAGSPLPLILAVIGAGTDGLRALVILGVAGAVVAILVAVMLRRNNVPLDFTDELRVGRVEHVTACTRSATLPFQWQASDAV